MEEWRRYWEVPIYEISDTGLVRNIRTGRIMKTYVNERGYEVVQLSYLGKDYPKRVHRLVAEAFDDGSHRGMEVTHRDGDKLNNNLDNLAWSTRKEIISNTYRNGREQTHRMRKVRCVETGEEFRSIGEASIMTGVNRWTISKCVNNPAVKTRKGYHFEPID